MPTENKKVDCLKDCPELGYCCRRFYIHRERGKKPLAFPMSSKGVMRFLRKNGLHFMQPLMMSTSERYWGSWWVTCTRLGGDGRCMDYENRPDFCRDFIPGGEDKLCLLSPIRKEGYDQETAP